MLKHILKIQWKLRSPNGYAEQNIEEKDKLKNSSNIENSMITALVYITRGELYSWVQSFNFYEYFWILS